MTQGPNVKLGVSISRELAEEADALAREIGVSRSGLYAIALKEFLRRRENASLLQRINDSYGEPDPEDEALVEGVKVRGRRVLEEGR